MRALLLLGLAAGAASALAPGAPRQDAIVKGDSSPSMITTRRSALRFAGDSAIVSAALASRPHVAVAASATGGSIASRLDTDNLIIPPTEMGRTEFSGAANLYFPDWMEGTWDVTQTLVNFGTPLGPKFVGGPSGSVQIAEKSIAEQQKQIGRRVDLQLRFVRTKWGVAEDRLFNLRSRLDAFAGRTVVARVEYADTGGSNRAGTVAMGGTENDPLLTTLVYYKGPAAQKTFSLARGGDFVAAGNGDDWAGHELSRSIFALTNQSTSPPVTTDTETIYRLKRLGDNAVDGRFRIADYLNAQSDKLYFEAKNRAVAINDYTLEMKRSS